MDVVKWEQPNLKRIGGVNDYPLNVYAGGSVVYHVLVQGGGLDDLFS